MIGQIFDLLAKKESDREKVILNILKFFFTAIITNKLYLKYRGEYDIISIADFKEIIVFILDGEAFICIILFFTVWALSYDLMYFIFRPIVVWISSKLFKMIFHLSTVTQDEIKKEIDTSKVFRFILMFLVKFLNSTDIIEYDNVKIKPGINYFKFYDYLIKIETGKKSVRAEHFFIRIPLIFQFVLIFKWLDLSSIPFSLFIYFSFVMIIASVFVFSFSAYALATFIDIKYSRILDYMNKMTPEYNADKRKAKSTTNGH